MWKFTKKGNDHKYEKERNDKPPKKPKSNIPDDIHTVKVTPKIHIYEQTTDGEDHRPIVLIFGWLRGKEQHLRKYTDIYLGQGCDVLQIQVGVKEIFIPNAARRLVRKVHSLCEESGRRSQPIFVHTFSSGVYLYGQFLLIETNTTDTDTQTDGCEDNGVQNRICGQIYDSPTDMYGFPLGLAEAATNNRCLKRFIKCSAELYLRIATRSAEAFQRSTVAVKANANGAPAMAIYSLEDKMCRPAMLEEERDRLIERGIIAQTETWNQVPHVSIYRYYPEKYSRSVSEFFRMCTLGDDNSASEYEIYPCVAHM